MANIPVEKRESGTPWWLWLLGLLLLALLLWFLIGLFSDDEEVVEADPVEAVVDEPGLDLSDVYVSRVVGDNTFFVTPEPGSGAETLVYLEEEPTPGDATEGRYDVTEGQHLSITGETLPVGTTDLSEWGLTPDQVSMVGDEYVRATSLTVLDGAMADGAIADDAMADGATADAADGAITSVADLESSIGPAAAGRQVDISGVTVSALAGDSTFYVGTAPNRVLVVLEDLGESQSGPGTGADGRFNVDQGNTVSIRGTVRAFDPAMRGTSSLPEADRTEATSRRYVVVVDRAGALSMQ